ncbi:hypothetical protein G3I55_23780, partial [Streptomyces sp. SID6648]|nr:hypothetical protein [Streptomyces sp. SID6648]
DRLPLQLGDVSEQVSSVFDAIDDDVAPLESMLPPSPERDQDGGAGGRPGRSGSTTTDTPDSGHSSAPRT